MHLYDMIIGCGFAATFVQTKHDEKDEEECKEV